jgi:hypothetical protein
MVLKRLIGLVFTGALAFSASAADVMVRIGPPHAVRERRPPPPSRNHVWVSGYHRWDGNAYAWAPGRWEQPPPQRRHWVAHHWTHQRGGWVLVEGHWR